MVDAGDSELRGRIPVEVKGDSRTGIASAVASMERSFGRGVVATRTHFEVRGNVVLVPMAVLLAGLTERTERRLSTL